VQIRDKYAYELMTIVAYSIVIIKILRTIINYVNSYNYITLETKL